MIATITDEALIVIAEIVNRGNRAVVQRDGTGVLVFEEKRKIKYSNASPNGKGKG